MKTRVGQFALSGSSVPEVAAPSRMSVHAGLRTLKPLPVDAKRRESLAVRRKVTPLGGPETTVASAGDKNNNV